MKNKPKRCYTRLIDLILNIILFIICIYAIWKAVRLSILPESWLLLMIAAYIIIFLIFFILMLKKTPRWVLVIKRTVLSLLCVVIGFIGYSMGNASKAIDKVSIHTKDSKLKIHVIANKNSDIQKLSDFNQKNIGLQSGTDQDNTAYGRQQLEAVIGTSANYTEEIAYSTLADLFAANMLDGMIITNDYLDMLNANIEGFQDSYTVIETYEKERPQKTGDQKDITKQSFVLLVSGVDEMGAADMTSLSDVNILLFINPISNSIMMLSLPRDSLMPRYSMDFVNDKLTHTGWAGVEDTKQTIEHFFGIEIDYYAKVSFSSLIEIVDAIGGIDVNVEIAFSEQDENRSFAADDLISLEAGEQHLNGKQALAYARHRKTENYDVAGRERAQQRIIKAIIDKLLTAEGITVYVNQLMDTVPKYVVTDMPGNQITSFIKGELSELKPWSIQSLSNNRGIFDTRAVPNIPQGADCYLWNQYDYAQVLDAYQATRQNLAFSEFNFSFSEPMKYLPEIVDNQAIVWDFLAQQPH